MSIESDIATLQTKCSEAEAFSAPFNTPAESVRVEVSAAMLRRLIQFGRRALAPKHLHHPKTGFGDTEGQGY